MPSLAHNNGQIYYEVAGSGEPIVFIHGFTLDHRMWQPQVDFFSKNYQVVTYNARGFGKSSVPTHYYSHDDDLHALLQHLNISSAHIVGLSMGGRIAINFALAYPDAVRTLTLMDSALDGYASTVDWNVHAKEVGIEGAKENWLNHEVFAGTREKPDVVAKLRPIIADYSGWHWVHEDMQDPADTNARTRLDEVKIPTLIMVGEKDLAYFHDIAKVLNAGIEGSHSMVVPNVGHMVNMEAPVVCNAKISELLLKA